MQKRALSLPVNQPVDYAKHDTPIAHACALGGSTKLSAGGFVLVSVEENWQNVSDAQYVRSI